MELSRHFIENWRSRVGGHPTEDVIRRILCESVRVQKGRDVYQANGNIFRVPAIYWHPDKRLFIKIDARNNVAITVLTEGCV